MNDSEGDPTRDPTDIAQRLRTALDARAKMIDAQDLRPASAPWSQGRRTHRTSMSPHRRIAAVAAAVTVAVGATLFVTDQNVGDRRPSVARHAESPVPASPASPISDGGRPPVQGAGPGLTVEFATASGAISGTAGRVTRPVAEAQGGPPEAAARARATLNGRIDHLIATVRSQQATVDRVRVDISVGQVAFWDRYLSVRFDMKVDPGDAYLHSRSSAVVLDTESGDAVDAARLFPDVDKIDRMMRTAITRTAGPTVREPAVVALSMRAGRDGTTDPLAWYPASDGLHWVVDQCSVASCAVGKPAAVLPWTRVGG